MSEQEALFLFLMALGAFFMPFLSKRLMLPAAVGEIIYGIVIASLIPYGDYYLVEYGQGVQYYIDKNNDLLKIDSLDDGARGIMSDYLRYSMKKSEID